VRVAIDYWPGVAHASGPGRYLRELVRALCALESGPELVLLDCGPSPRTFSGDELGLDRAAERVRRLSADVPRGLLPRLSRWGVDLAAWTGPCELSLGVFPEQPPLPRSWRVRALAELPPAGSTRGQALAAELARASDVLVFGHAARRACSERLNLDPQRIHVMPLGCEHWARQVVSPAATPARLICLGRIDRRRAPLALLAGFEELLRRGARAELWFVGRGGDQAAEFGARWERSPARECVRWCPPPPERELAALVGRSAALVHLSTEEWTAVTPLEALAQGLAALVSPLETFRETLEGQVLYAADLEPRSLCDALERALALGTDAKLRAARRTFARAFTWERQAHSTLDCWRRIAVREGLGG
jgi:glycosyltransferase involved in cell wall biosynthesis